ncbi:MAG: flagellar basal body-associated FliL family protein [Bacteriovoracaceae bacterium]|nr:flagellar basal body-associated FliL family protein [Bacteriovoracaceae bacterium]
MAISLVCSLGSAGLVYYSHNMIEKPKTNKQKEFNDMAQSAISDLQSPRISMEEISVNLYSRKTRLRFLNVKMDIEVYKEEYKDNLSNFKSIINDQLIDVAGNMKADQLNSITGKILLESRIKKRLNEIFGASTIKKIYFSKFIIQ